MRFLKAKCKRPAEIHAQIFAVFGNIMNRQNVRKCYREFSEGKTDVHDEQRSGRPSVISEEILQEIEGEIHANRRVTIRELHHIIPEVSETTIHEAATGKLGYRNCAHLFVVNISPSFGEFTAPLRHILPIHNVTTNSNSLFVNFRWTPTFALRNRTTERTSHLEKLWIGAAISNTSHSNEAGLTTFKRKRPAGKGPRPTAMFPQ